MTKRELEFFFKQKRSIPEIEDWLYKYDQKYKRDLLNASKGNRIREDLFVSRVKVEF